MKAADAPHIDIQTVVRQNKNLKQENAQLKDRIAWFEKQFFGSKSEKMPSEQNALQGSLFDQEEPKQAEQQAEDVEVPAHKRKKRKPGQNRKPLPDHLDRVEEYIEPDFDTTGMTKIGEERTEFLEIQPERVYVRVLIRPKYANGETVKIPALPDLLIPQGNAGASLLTYILIAKYVDHLPLYRISKRFEREGIHISRSTMGDWVGCAAERWLKILYERMAELILDTGYAQLDESHIMVQDRLKKGKCHRGFYWVYYSPIYGMVFFDYRRGRDRASPESRLKDFSGYLQTDGYSVYDIFAKDDGPYPNITMLYCMAHVRRKFHEALSNDGARAKHALNLIGRLYAIEDELSQLKPEMELEHWHQMRHQVRMDRSVPILAEFKAWLLEQAGSGQLLPKSKIGKAVSYALGRIKDGLNNYVLNGCLEIDNNLVENQIRPLALGRKNYMFAGSHQGALRSAIIYSLLGSCRHNGINPQQWLLDVLTKLPSRKANDIDDLLPHNWKPNTITMEHQP